MARDTPSNLPSAGPRVPRHGVRRRGGRCRVVGWLAGLAALGGCGLDRPLGGGGRWGSAPADGPLVHVILEGTPYEMGAHQGRLLRDAIRARVARPLPPEIADVLPGYAGLFRDLLPVGAADELRGIAAGAGVDETALFAREIARDVLRWHVPDTDLAFASFASAPGDAPCLAVAYGHEIPALGGRFRGGPSGSGTDAPSDLVLVERHPVGGTATMVLAAPGSVGGFAGVSARGVVAACAEDGSREPQQRSLRGAPFPVGLRYALERGADGAAVVAALPRTLGHRVLVADAANVRVSALLALAGEDPVHSPAAAWVIRPADGPVAAENVEAQDRKLGSYTRRPGCADALDLAEAGFAPTPAGEQLLRFDRDGVEVAHARADGARDAVRVVFSKGDAAGR